MEKFIEFDSLLEKVRPQAEQLSRLIRDAIIKVLENRTSTGQETAAITLMGLTEGVSKVLWCMDEANGTLDSRAAYETFIKTFSDYCEALYMENEIDTDVN